MQWIVRFRIGHSMFSLTNISIGINFPFAEKKNYLYLPMFMIAHIPERDEGRDVGIVQHYVVLSRHHS